jgi:1-acyl-sn-glycerol-3-phosphate acyltransferase
MVKILAMSFGYFSSTSYRTPDPKPGLMTWIRQDNWFLFLSRYAGVVLRTRKQARNKKYHDKEWADSSLEILRIVEGSGGIFDISGMEHTASPNEPVIFLSNHMSTLETMVFPCLITPHRKVTFVVKDSLVRHPLFKDVMLSREPIVVGRTDARKDFETVMTEGAEILNSGKSLIIFPQSTRSDVFVASEFNSLGVKLAKKTGVKVVPMAIKTDFWGNGKIIKEIGKLDHKKIIHIRFSEPINISGNGKEENQHIINFISENLRTWGGVVA